MKRYLWIPTIAIALFVSAWTTSAAKTVDLDALTIADINRAFDAGALTSEKLVQLCLARIQAYDRQGPSLHAVLTLNPKALETARALDAERKLRGPRSPLHGVPIVLKDNYNTFDLPTTGGSVLLEGSKREVRHAAIAVGSCSARPVRIASLEREIVRSGALRETVAAGVALPELAPISDVRATAAYRAHAARELVADALDACASLLP